MTDVINFDFRKEFAKLSRAAQVPEQPGDGEHYRLPTPQDVCVAFASTHQSLAVLAEFHPSLLLRTAFTYKDIETGRKGATDIHGAITILRDTLTHLEVAVQNRQAGRAEAADFPENPVKER